MEFCYLRAGRGKASSATDADGLDVRWNDYVWNAKSAGLDVGGYWRFYPSVPLDRQVTEFTDRLANSGSLQLPPMVDIEDADGLDLTALTDWAVKALTSVHGRTGVLPLLYTNRSFLAKKLQADRLAQWPLALAFWTDDPAWPAEQPVFWQYAGATDDPRTVVPWAAGRVDLQRRRV